MTTTATKTMTDFCEQVNPLVLRDLRDGEKINAIQATEARRVQKSWVAAVEKHALLWLAERTPEGVGPDHLTALGLFAQIGAGVCYALAARYKFALLGVIGCLALNWFGDSLDGTLARVRDRKSVV